MRDYASTERTECIIAIIYPERIFIMKKKELITARGLNGLKELTNVKELGERDLQFLENQLSSNYYWIYYQRYTKSFSDSKMKRDINKLSNIEKLISIYGVDFVGKVVPVSYDWLMVKHSKEAAFRKVHKIYKHIRGLKWNLTSEEVKLRVMENWIDTINAIELSGILRNEDDAKVVGKLIGNCATILTVRNEILPDLKDSIEYRDAVEFAKEISSNEIKLRDALENISKSYKSHRDIHNIMRSYLEEVKNN